MAPRRRSRTRNTRMDAAIDAMRPFGFTESLVRQTVKKLLKVYGGEDYWPFVEENGYRELIEILVEANSGEAEYSDEGKGEGSHLQSNSTQEQEAPATSVCLASNAIADSESIGSDVAQAVSESVREEAMENVEPPESFPPARNLECDPGRPSEGNRDNWKDIRLDQNSDENKRAVTVSNNDGFAQTNNLPAEIPAIPLSSTAATSVRPANHHAIRRPCYGWLDYDEGKLDFICLTPAARQAPPPSVVSGHSDGKTNKRIRRKSRWDLKPGDP